MTSLNDFRTFAKYYDSIYLKMKDYEKEADIIKDIIVRLGSKETKTLIDVGCGTGEHLKYLSSDFQCMGIDIDKYMIKIAREKVTNAEFKVANMMDFTLEERFDVVICLFSSIGYVQNFDNLVRTLENFYKHLNYEGIVIVEPWVFKKDFKEGHMGLSTYEDEEVKLARIGTTEIIGSNWFIYLHYLIGERGEVRYKKEVHTMIASDYEDYIRAFESSGFEDVKFLKENLWNGCRGLFVGTKRSTPI